MKPIIKVPGAFRHPLIQIDHRYIEFFTDTLGDSVIGLEYMPVRFTIFSTELYRF